MPRAERRCPGCNHFTQRTTQDLCEICTQGIRIPVEDFRPILKQLISERNYYQVNGEWQGGWSALIHEVDRPDSRVYPRTISGVLNGDIKTVYYNFVDRVLTRTNNFQLWYAEPLCKWYHEPRTRQPKRNRSRTKPCACGKLIEAKSSQCRACWKAERQKHYPPVCVTCGGEKANKRSQNCWDCYIEKRYGKKRKARKAALNKAASGRFALARATK